jgi:hypothetical protein
LPSFFEVYHLTTRGVDGEITQKCPKLCSKHFVQMTECKYENSWLPCFLVVYNPIKWGVKEEITQKCPK